MNEIGIDFCKKKASEITALKAVEQLLMHPSMADINCVGPSGRTALYFCTVFA